MAFHGLRFGFERRLSLLVFLSAELSLIVVSSCHRQIIVNAILVSTPLYTNIWGRYGLYLLLPAQGAIGAILMNWATEITGFDNEKRAMTIVRSFTFARP